MRIFRQTSTTPNLLCVLERNVCVRGACDDSPPQQEGADDRAHSPERPPTAVTHRGTVQQMKIFLALCIVAIVVTAGGRASAKANVIENQSTYLYVDAKAGSDNNSGAQSSPLKTVQ